MKKHFFLYLSLFIGIVTSYSQKTSDTKQLPINGFFTNPIASPDTNYVLLTGEHYHGVFLLDARTNQINQISDVEGSGYGYCWNEDSSSFYFKQKDEGEYNSNAKVYNYNIGTKKTEVLENINNTYLPSYSGFDKKRNSNIVVYTNTATLKIEAIDLYSSKKWVVTKDDGQFYNAILSHDGTKVAVHKGADVYIYDTNGSDKGIKLGTGIVTSWSRDDKYLIGFLDESKDGHQVSNSEIYLFDALNAKQTKLTSTEETIEMFPSFYGNDKLIFSDDKTGHIYISNLKL